MLLITQLPKHGLQPKLPRTPSTVQWPPCQITTSTPQIFLEVPHQLVQTSHFSWTSPHSTSPQSFQYQQKLDDPFHPTLAPSKKLNFCDLSTTSSDPRVRDHALLSLLLTYQDTDIRLVNKTGHPVAKAACPLPMQLGNVWQANFHQPEKVDHALYWLEDTYRMEELNAFNLTTPISSQAFFQRKVI
jgi:hypothetical protein